MTVQTQVFTGIDRFLTADVKKPYIGKRLGLITNQTGVTRHLVPTVDALANDDELKLRALFGPEHGVRGDAQAGEDVGTATDPETGLPSYSLYGNGYKPTPKMLADVDTLVFDIQDAGVRFFTYVSTMYHAMEAAAEQGLEFAVLDRPNPITGVKLEGNMLEPDFRSFVGVQPMLLRHGMTVGELALYFNDEFNVGADLKVIKMEGWRRELWYDGTDLPWVIPGPNVPTLESLILYPGTCLIEGTNVSEGRGTTLSFVHLGAPWINAGELTDALNSLELPGVRFRPARFRPMFHKHAGDACQGVQLHLTDREAFLAVETGLHLIRTLMDLYPDDLDWRTHPKTGAYALDRLMGTDRVRKAFEAGDSVAKIMEHWDDDKAAFVQKRDKHLLY